MRIIAYQIKNFNLETIVFINSEIKKKHCRQHLKLYQFTFKSYSTKEENYQHHIRKYGRNVHDFSRRSDSLHHANIHQRPSR